jgi:hypothetical protein
MRFKRKKEFDRHRSVHEPGKYACSCGRKYVRYDGLKRHINEKAQIPNEAGKHKAAESTSK